MMKRNLSQSGILALFLVALTVANAQQSPATLLQQAIFAEETEGDIESATKLYETILSVDLTNQPIVAQATFRLALCHLKSGRRAEAIALFNQLIKRFPGTSDWRKKALVQLTELGATKQSRSVELVWDHAPEIPSSVSPDGRYLLYLDWSNGNIARRDLINQEATSLTDDGTWDGDTAFGLDPQYSPDGKQIAYVWYEGRNAEIRIMDADGKNRRRLFPPSETQSRFDFQLGDWAPDLKRIYLQIKETPISEDNQANDDYRISAIDTATGREQAITSHSPWVKPIKVSPDGRYLAFSDTPPMNKDIYLLDTQTGFKQTLIKHPASDSVIGWADAATMLFTSNRANSFDLWRLQINEDGTNTEPRKHHASVGDLVSIGKTYSGDFFYILSSQPSDLFIANMDWEASKLAEPPRHLLPNNLGRSAGSSLSPSGKKLLYSVVGPTRSVCVMDLATETVTCVTTPHGANRPYATPTWSPDEQAIVVWDVVPGFSESGLYHIDLTTGELNNICLNRHEYRLSKITQFSSDGNQVYYIRNHRDEQISTVWKHDLSDGNDTLVLTIPGGFDTWADHQFVSHGPTVIYPRPDERGETRTLIAHNLVSGTERTLLAVKPNTKTNVSPDVSWLLEITKSDEEDEIISAYRIENTETKRISSGRTPAGFNSFGDGISRGWAHRQNHFLFRNNLPKDDKRGLDRIYSFSLTSGQIVPLGIELPRMYVPHISPDSGKVYYWGFSEQNDQIWRSNFNQSLTTTGQ